MCNTKFRPVSEIVENPVLILNQDLLNSFIRLTSATQKHPSLKSIIPAQYNQHICSFYFYMLRNDSLKTFWFFFIIKPLEFFKSRKVCKYGENTGIYHTQKFLWCFKRQAAPISSGVWTLGPELVMLFGEVSEVQPCWRRWDLRMYSFALLAIHSVLLARGWVVTARLLFLLPWLSFDALLAFWNRKPN